MTAGYVVQAAMSARAASVTPIRMWPHPSLRASGLLVTHGSRFFMVGPSYQNTRST